MPSLRDLPTLEELTLPLDGYIRVSRVGDRSGESYISPDIQRQAIERWGADRGIEIVVHEPEENVSGGTMDRPIFNRIMGRIRADQTGGIVVYKLDRFARTLVGGLTTLNEIADARRVFASATEPLFDFTTADGRMFLSMNLMMAEYFRERTKEQWAASLEHAVGRGVHISPTLAYGYSKDSNKRLVPNHAGPSALAAFEQRARGVAFPRIASWLNDNAPARPDGERWTARSVEAMIRRRVYLGVAHWGNQENPEAHPALVPEDTWHAAQRKVHTFSKKLKGDEVALLHGLMRCAGCRFCMSRARHGSADDMKHARFFYRCRKHRQSGTCRSPAMIRADRQDGVEAYVERVVCAELDRLVGTYESVDDVASLADAIVALTDARADLEAFRQDTSARRRLGERWSDFLDPHLQAVDAAEMRVAELRKAARPDVTGVTSAAYLALPRNERAQVLAAMIDVVFVRRPTGRQRGPQSAAVGPDRVHILWRGQGPVSLPSTNARSDIVSWPWPEVERPSGMDLSEESL
ncbi:recombinase family protein [Baekduia soli]|nr:recombinase family protein [Baekduia soli]